jgi:biopolymer transport protein ExbD
MKRRFSSQSTVEEPVINLTPLIDVVFVVLIVFILVAPLLDIDKIQLAPGINRETEEVSKLEASQIRITVTEENIISLNHEEIREIDLEPALKEIFLKYPKASPQVIHDKKAPFGTYQAIKNAAEKAGFSDLELILKPV